MGVVICIFVCDLWWMYAAAPLLYPPTPAPPLCALRCIYICARPGLSLPSLTWIHTPTRNEPHGLASWGESNPLTDYNHYYERLINRLKAKYPDWKVR